MSGSAGGVMSEYLVRLTYQVNAASQASFVRSLVESSTSGSQAASAMYRLGMAIVHMTHKMAEASDKLYWMGQRLASSVQGIDQATYAMTQLGASASDASSSFEGLGSFIRSNGPAALNFLRSMGVTATDSAGRMRQIGDALRAMGMRPGQEGTIGYARGKAYGEAVGLNENTMRAITSDEYREREREKADLAKSVGLNMDAAAAAGNRLMTVFRQFDALFDVISKKFGQNIMGHLADEFGKIYNVIKTHLPQISKFFEYLGNVIVMIVRVFRGMVEVVGQLATAFYGLENGLKAFIGALAVVASGLLATPLGWVLLTLGAIMLLLEDYLVWKDKGKSAINWGFTEDLGKTFDNLIKNFDKWFESVTGVKGALCTVVEWLTWINSFKFSTDDVFKKLRESVEWLGRAFMDLWHKMVPPGSATPDPSTAPGMIPANYTPGGGGGAGWGGMITNAVASGGFMQGGSGGGPSGADVMAFLQSAQGGSWSAIQAAGIIGNLQQESGLRPDAKGDGGAAFGMAQWHPDRQANFARLFGKPIQQASWQEQLQFLNYELTQGQERNAGRLLRGSTTVAEATMAMLSSERPKNWNTDPAELMKRLPFANRAAMLPGSVSGMGMPISYSPGMPGMGGFGGMGGGGGVTLNQTTNINVPAGPTAAETANRVGRGQERVNEAMVRNVRAVLT